MTDVAHPQLLALVERKHQWDAAWTSMATYLSGKVSRRFDSARTLTLSVPNPNGKATDDWKVGDQVRVSLGWNRKEALPIFEGVVPPGRGLQVAGPPPTMRISAIDALGLLTNEYVVISPASSTQAPATALEWDMETLNAGLMRDLSGNGNHGTIFGATDAAGKHGRARDFNGTSDYIEAADANSLDITGPLTIGARVNLHVGETDGRIAGKWNSDLLSEWNYGLFIQSNHFRVGWGTSDGNLYRAWDAAFTPASSTWYDVVALIQPPTATIFIDGVAQSMTDVLGGTGTSNPVANARPFRVGQNSGNWFAGLVDHVWVFPRVLSTTEIVRLRDSDSLLPPTLSTYVGWEGGMAIRDVMLTAKVAPLLGDLSAMKGSNPIRWIGKHISEKTGVQTRKAYVDAVLVALTDDETNADVPRPYHYWMTAKADGTPAVYLQKQRDPAVDPPVRTISHLTDLLGAGVELRSDQATSALAYASGDVTKWVRYEDDEAAARYGRLEASLSVASTNTDDLGAEARRAVQIRRYPVRSFTVTVRDALRHELNQVVALVNPRYGGSGNFLLVGIDFDFSPGGVQAQLRLASSEELITAALK